MRVAAAPVDGAANEALLRFLAETLGVTRGAVELVAGGGSRSKIVGIRGLDVASGAKRLGL